MDTFRAIYFAMMSPVTEERFRHETNEKLPSVRHFSCGWNTRLASSWNNEFWLLYCTELSRPLERANRAQCLLHMLTWQRFASSTNFFRNKEACREEHDFRITCSLATV